MKKQPTPGELWPIEKMENNGDVTFKSFPPIKQKETDFDQFVLPVLPLEAILKDAVKRKAKYSVQFIDYSIDTWTAAVELTQNRMDKLLDDNSIRKFRIEYEN